MKNNLNRIKKLMNLITEEMKVSKEINNIQLKKQDNENITFLKIAEDETNDNEHNLFLYLMFDKKSFTKMPELSFFFQVTDINKKITSKPTTIYNRNDAKKYLPKELIGKGIITNKINEMFNKLITMEKPTDFIMSTYESLSGNSLKRFDSLIKTIIENGYKLNEHKPNGMGGMYWIFSLEKQINESKLTKEEMDEFLIEYLKPRTQDDYDRVGMRVHNIIMFSKNITNH